MTLHKVSIRSCGVSAAAAALVFTTQSCALTVHMELFNRSVQFPIAQLYFRVCQRFWLNLHHQQIKTLGNVQVILANPGLMHLQSRSSTHTAAATFAQQQQQQQQQAAAAAGSSSALAGAISSNTEESSSSNEQQAATTTATSSSR